MLRLFAHPVACCWMLLHVVVQGLKPVKLFSQQLPTFLLFHDRQSVAQQCWICLAFLTSANSPITRLSLILASLNVHGNSFHLLTPNIIELCPE